LSRWNNKAGQRCAVGAALHALVARVDAPQAGFDSAHGLASRCALARALQTLLAAVPAVPREQACSVWVQSDGLASKRPIRGFRAHAGDLTTGLACAQRLLATS